MSRTVDELERMLAEADVPSEQVDLLVELADLLRRENPVKAQSTARSALKLATDTADQRRIATALVTAGFCDIEVGSHATARRRLERVLKIDPAYVTDITAALALRGIGIIHTVTGQPAAALEVLERAHDRAVLSGDRKTIALVGISIGIAHKSIGNLVRALDWYFRSRAFFEEIGDETGLRIVTNNMGTVYLSLGDLERAREEFERSLELSSLAGDQRARLVCLENLGSVLQAGGKVELALAKLREALELSIALGCPSEEMYSLSSIGMLESARGNHGQAVEILERAWTLAERHSNLMRWVILSELGKAHSACGRHDRALDCLQRALGGVIEQGDRDGEHLIHQALSKCHEAAGNLRAALEHHRKSVEIREEVAGREQQRAAVELRLRTEIERGVHEREILRLKTDQMQSELEHRESELASAALRLVEKNRFLGSLKREMSGVAHTSDPTARPVLRGLLRQVEGNLEGDEDWRSFETQFEMVHNGFLDMLSRSFPRLTRTELRVCALLRLNLSTKEIAQVLATSTKNIEVHRYRIRKKMNLPADTTFARFFSSL